MTTSINQVSTQLKELENYASASIRGGDYENVLNCQEILAAIGKNHASIIRNNDSLKKQFTTINNLLSENVNFLLDFPSTKSSSAPAKSSTSSSQPSRKSEKKEAKTQPERKPTPPITSPKPRAEPVIPADGITVHSRDMETLPPVGIANNNSNCWANSLMQTLANSPSIAAKILKTPALKNLAKLLQQYYQGQIDGVQVAKMNSEELRASARALNSKFSTSLNGRLDFSLDDHEDPYDALIDILKAVNITPFLTQTHTQKNREGNLVWTEAPRTIVKHDLMIELWMPTGRSYAFEELFGEAFDYENEHGSTFQLKFSEIPSEFFVHAKRFTEDGRKIETPMKLSSYFHLDARYTQNNQAEVYELVGGMIHIGTSINVGHYIAIEKRGNKWYRINDSLTEEISEQVALKELGKGGYILKYRKVEAQPARQDALQNASQIVPAQNQNNRTLAIAKGTAYWTAWGIWKATQGLFYTTQGLFYATKFTITTSASLINRIFFSKKKTV